MRAVSIIIVVCSILISLSFGSLIINPDKDKLLIEVITYVMQRGHFNPKKIDDSFSENVFRNYINDINHFFKIFERAASIAKNEKANFYVFMIPSAQKLNGDKDYSQSEKIKKELEKRNIKVIDLFKELISDSSEEFYPFNYKPAHFSKNGYNQVANFINNFIESN